MSERPAPSGVVARAAIGERRERGVRRSFVGTPASDEARVVELLGACAERIPGGGEVRPLQERLALSVLDAIKSGGKVAIRAGTGVGKSLGYLVPLIVAGTDAVIATATYALQDQLVQRDLALLSEAAKARGYAPVSVARIRGRQAYACRAMVEDVLRARERPPELLGLLDWLGRTTRGEREELTPSVSDALWRRVSVGATDCAGASKCPFAASCFSEAARRDARRARFVLATLHLVAADLVSGGAVLPERSVLVVDECHMLAPVLTEVLGATLDAARLTRIVERAARLGIGATADVALWRREVGLFDAALNDGRGERISPSAPGPLRASLVVCKGALVDIAELAEEARECYAGSQDPDARAAAGALGRLAQSARSAARAALKMTEPRDGVVHFVDRTGAVPSARMAPISVAPFLERSTLWASRPACLVSADASVELCRQLGLPEGAYVDLGSPWDLREKALLWVPDRTAPEPATPGWGRFAVATTRRFVAAAGGRALVLCTSWRMLEAMRQGLAAEGHLLLVQGDAGRGELLERFVAQERSVLVATRTFFTGVDAPGPTLSLLVVDRIPFPFPDEPLTAARRHEAGPSGFAEVDLAEASVALHQALGRLIRRADDEGMAVVLDRRLCDRGYGKRLLAALEPMPVERDEKQALDWISALAARLEEC